jgi:opacity protein-like surface antigen
VVRAVVLATLAFTAHPPLRLSAQGVLEQFSYDSLRLSGLQADLGALGASRLRGTIVGGVRLDVGYIAPRVRVLLGLSYFRGDFDRKAIADLTGKLRSIVTDPDSNFTIDVGRISWADLTGDVDLQYVFPQGRSVTTYLGLGVGVHLRNGSGKAIDGTFVEDALDGISAGLNGTIGAEFGLGLRWRLTVEGRGVVSTDLSTASLRAGVMYRFQRERR